MYLLYTLLKRIVTSGIGLVYSDGCDIKSYIGVHVGYEFFKCNNILENYVILPIWILVTFDAEYRNT